MILFKVLVSLWGIFILLGCFFQNVVPNSRADRFMVGVVKSLVVFTVFSAIYGIWCI